jgi:hypothetical protein
VSLRQLTDFLVQFQDLPIVIPGNPELGGVHLRHMLDLRGQLTDIHDRQPARRQRQFRVPQNLPVPECIGLALAACPRQARTDTAGAEW